MDKRLFFVINKAQQKIFRHFGRRAEKHLGVSPVQIGALFFVDKNKGCLLKELSSGLDLQNSAITGLVARMEKAGLLQRKTCTDDARATRIYLTKKASSILENAKPLLVAMNQDLSKGFSEAEMLVVLRFLNKLIERF